MLTRPASWTTYFNKPFLENCDVYIYDDNDSLLVDKTYINKYSWKGESSFVCNSMPVDEATLVIRGWSKLSSTKKTYLTTIGNMVSIGYVIGGDESGWRVMYIKDFNYDTTNLLMTIKFRGKLQGMANKTSVQMNVPVQNATEIATQIDQYFSYEGNSDFILNYVPSKITEAQTFQNLALTLCGGLRNKGETTNLEIISYPNATLTFNKSNIFNRVKYYSSDISSNVEVLGSYVITGAGVSKTYLGQHNTRTNQTTTFNLENDYYVNFTTTQESPASPQYLRTFTIFNDKLVFSTTQVALLLGVNADYLRLEQSQNQGYTTISSYFFYNTSGQKSKVQQYASAYYSFNLLAEFECRIDPCLEPLDCIYTNGEYILLESVSIEFNGAFRGKIIGRKQTKLFPPLIKNITYSGSAYSFEIYNPNPVRITCFIKYGQNQTASVLISGSLWNGRLNSYASITISSSNCPDLDDSFYDKYRGLLQDDVYVYFTEFAIHPSLTQSEIAVVIEED